MIFDYDFRVFVFEPVQSFTDKYQILFKYCFHNT